MKSRELRRFALEGEEEVFLVPFKGLKRAKSRLAPLLEEESRSRLALWMLRRTVELLPGPVVLAVDEEPPLSALNLAKPLSVVRAPAGSLNKALNYALKRLGPVRVSVVPTDLLDPRAAGFRKEPRSVVVVPDRHRSGTNLISLPPGLNFEFRFGNSSFLLHCLEALTLGCSLDIREVPGIREDIDTPSDLIEHASILPEWLELNAPPVTFSTC